MNFPTHEQALRTLLDQVDYMADPPACRVNEMVGATLPKEVLTLCHEALSHPIGAEARALNVLTRGLMAMVVTFERMGVPNVETFTAAVQSMMQDALLAARNEV
jgi:hypothetical protein